MPTILRPTRRFSAAVPVALLLGVCLFSAVSAHAQRRDVNEDEAQVKPYTLPDPLVMADGTTVDGPADWWEKRRPELMRLFETLEYGVMPGKPDGLAFQVFSHDENALGGRATRKEIDILFTGKPDGPRMRLLLYVPNQANKPVPAFLGLNFQGNHTVAADPGVALATVWSRDAKADPPSAPADESTRGAQASRWQIEMVLERGYATATAYYGDIDPDFDDGFQNGVHPIFDHFPAGERPGDAWGSIGAWAWGLSRALDYLETDPDVDATRVAVHGHSRLGKTALWAGATDPRFAVTISNDSGAGGAALHKRNFGETVKVLNTAFPHWFCDNFNQFNDREADMPFDQHELIALIAPRPVLVCSAEDDKWADPRGEFLAARHAGPVYKLLGTDGMAADDMPPLSTPVLSTVGYHVRPGGHDVTAQDWGVFLDFADRRLARPKQNPAGP